MAALEAYLLRSVAAPRDKLCLDAGTAEKPLAVDIPLASFTRYSWMLHTAEGWAPRSSRTLFLLANSLPVLLVFGVLLAAGVSLYNEEAWLALFCFAAESAVGLATLLALNKAPFSDANIADGFSRNLPAWVGELNA